MYLSRQDSMINLPQGCADSHGYCISGNVFPPTGPQTQKSFARQHGNESTKLDWISKCCVLSFQWAAESPGMRVSEHTLPKGSFLWASLNGSNSCIPVLPSDFSVDRKETPGIIRLFCLMAQIPANSAPGQSHNHFSC